MHIGRLGKPTQVIVNPLKSKTWSVAVPVATGASREAPVDNECFSTILTTRNPGISGLVPTLAKLSACSGSRAAQKW